MIEKTLTFNEIIATDGCHVITRTIVANESADRVAGTVLGQVTASKKYDAYLDANEDGTETAKAILMATVPAGANDVKAPILVTGIVRRKALTGLDDNGEADLAATGVHMDTEKLS